MFQVTASNYVAVEDGLDTLRVNRARIERCMGQYPLLVEIAGYQWCLQAAIELEELIAKLAAKLGAFRVQQQRRAA